MQTNRSAGSMLLVSVLCGSVAVVLSCALTLIIDVLLINQFFAPDAAVQLLNALLYFSGSIIVFAGAARLRKLLWGALASHTAVLITAFYWPDALLTALQFSCWAIFLLSWFCRCFRLGVLFQAGFVLSQLVLIAIAVSVLSVDVGLVFNLPLNHHISYSVISAVFLLLLAIASLLSLFTRRLYVATTSYSPAWLLTALIIVIFSGFWLLFFKETQQEQYQKAERVATEFTHQLRELISEQRLTMGRVSERFGKLPSYASAELLNYEQRNYLRDFNYVDYIAAFDSAGKLHRSTAKQAEIKQNFDQSESLTSSLLAYRQSEHIEKTQATLICNQDTEHMFIVASIPQPNAANLSVITARLDFSDTIKHAMKSAEQLGLTANLKQNFNHVTLHSSRYSARQDTLVGTFGIDMAPGSSWELELFYKIDASKNYAEWSVVALLLSGWLTTALAIMSQLLFAQNERRKSRLLKSNRRLHSTLANLKTLRFQQQKVMENVADVICVTNEQHQFLELSDSALRILGYTSQELNGKSLLDYVHKEDKANTEAVLNNIIQGGGQPQFRSRHINKNGHVVHVMWSSHYLQKEKLLYSVIRDVTELVKREQFQQAQQSVLKMISTEQPLSQILQLVCFMLQQQDAQLKACVMLVAGEQLYPGAAPSLSGHLQQLLLAEPLTDKGSAFGTAAGQKRLVQLDNIGANTKCRNFASEAASQGIQAGIIIPLRSATDALVGIFSLFLPQAGAASQEQLEWAMVSSQLATLAIERAEQKRLLIESEQSYRSLYDNNPDLVCSLDQHGRFISINTAGCKLLQASQAEIMQHTIYSMLAPEDVAGMQLHLAHVLAGESSLFEVSILENNGTTLRLEFTCVPIRVDDEIIAVSGLARDITLQRTAEQQLRLFKRAIDSTLNGVIIADTSVSTQPVVYVNKAFEQLSGLKQHEVRDVNFLEVLTDNDTSIETMQLKKVISNRQEFTIELKKYHRDNKAYWVKLSLTPITDENGRVTHYVAIENDITAQKRYEQELSFNSSHDMLTGLPNRHLLNDRLMQSFKLVQRQQQQQQLAVLFMNLDGFKQINDSLGHTAGDELLKIISERISALIEPGDTFARLNGDEFVLVLTNIGCERQLAPQLDTILLGVSNPATLNNTVVNISCSIGISVSSASLTEPMALVKQAEIAMHKAKQSGRNMYIWYSDDMSYAENKQSKLQHALKNAIKNEEFELYYQPQIDALSGEVVGLEALLRWQHGEHGFISPNEFIPVAEKTGEIVPLSNWVINEASRYNQSLIRRGLAKVVMAVNISSIHFQRSNFVAQLQQSISDNGLNPQFFEVELTESLLFDNVEKVILTLQQLKQMGIQISIDDFGTGYSSLNYLKRLPIDKIKIDRSFISDIISDKRDAAISKAIIAMAHQLDIKVIAEGVENEAQMAFLRKNFCDKYQGYLFARPMPAAELERFLQHYKADSIVKRMVTGADKILLLLDDEENILRALKRLLRTEPYRVIACTTAQQAFEALALNDVQVVMSDQRMPEMSGTEFLRQVKDLYPDTIRLVLSGYTDLRSVTEAINHGAIYKFMTKPWQDEELREEIRKAFLLHDKNKRLRQH